MQPKTKLQKKLRQVFVGFDPFLIGISKTLTTTSQGYLVNEWGREGQVRVFVWVLVVANEEVVTMDVQILVLSMFMWLCNGHCLD